MASISYKTFSMGFAEMGSNKATWIFTRDGGEISWILTVYTDGKVRGWKAYKKHRSLPGSYSFPVPRKVAIAMFHSLRNHKDDQNEPR